MAQNPQNAVAQPGEVVRNVFQALHTRGEALKRFPGTYNWPDPYDEVDNWSDDWKTRYQAAVGQVGVETMAIAMHADPFAHAFKNFNWIEWQNLMLVIVAERHSLRMFGVTRRVPYVKNYRKHSRNGFLKSLGALNSHPMLEETEHANFHPHIIYLSTRGEPLKCKFTPEGEGAARRDMINTYENRYSAERFARYTRLPSWPRGWDYPRHPQYAATTEGESADFPLCEHCDKPAIHPSYVQGGTLHSTFEPDSLCTCSKNGKKPWETEPIVEIYQFPSFTDSIAEVNRGVRALQDIQKGELIGEYNGTFIPLQEEDSCGDGDYLLNFLGPSATYPSPPTNGIPTSIIAGGERGNWTRFMNHTDNPNEMNAQMFQSVYGGAMRIIVQAVKDIAFGEQIFTTYGTTYFEGGGSGSGGPKRTEARRYRKTLCGVPWQEGGLFDTLAEVERRKRPVARKTIYPNPY